LRAKVRGLFSSATGDAWSDAKEENAGKEKLVKASSGSKKKHLWPPCEKKEGNRSAGKKTKRFSHSLIELQRGGGQA